MVKIHRMLARILVIHIRMLGAVLAQRTRFVQVFSSNLHGQLSCAGAPYMNRPYYRTQCECIYAPLFSSKCFPDGTTYQENSDAP